MRVRRVAAVLLACVLLLSGCQSGGHTGYVQAAVDPAPETAVEVVYVTKTGSKYHRKGCRYLKDSCQEISMEKARREYEPCSVCRPPA